MIYVKDVSRLFYQKYEPKEVLGKGASSTVRHINHIGSKQQYVHFKMAMIRLENESIFGIPYDTTCLLLVGR